jgi:hypothetical protein
MGKSDPSRRDFLISFGLTCLAVPEAAAQPAAGKVPWYRRTYRWGQTNIAEDDPLRYDIDWWRQHWKRTQVQGLIVNAGGIVAYYPTRHQLQYRAEHLKERDLYGDIVRAAHEDGLVVLGRMDSNRAREDFYEAHRDWFAVDASGNPYRAADRYVTCISSPYYEEYIPGVLREIIAWEKPDGFTDNSWSGLDRDSICCCRHCVSSFREFAGLDVPRTKDWQDPAFRRWIEWSYRRRLQVWELNNRVTRAAGGPDCIWSGMIGGNLASEARRFRDHREICRRADIIMFDDQGRSRDWGFQSNSEMGKRIHGVLGWDKLMPESMAMYQRAPTFRKSANTPAEARMWMVEGIAGNIQPWWHHVGAYQEDRRQFQTAEPVYRWYASHQEFLVNRSPLAKVGVVWSQRNVDFYGRDEPEDLAIAPYRGMIQALVRARIPYIPVHVDDIERETPHLSVLVLPDIACMTEAQAAAVRRFADHGAVLSTGQTSLMDEWGESRRDFLLAGLFGAHAGGRHLGTGGPADTARSDHTYLRISPDVGREVYGPRAGAELPAKVARHEVLRGFEQTNILPFGGRLEVVDAEPSAHVPLTFVPHFPVYPPEFSWMREPRTTVPALVLLESGAGRRAYLPADIDRRFAHDHLPDHADLLSNIVRWLSGNDTGLEVAGPGLLDCHVFRQAQRLVIHIINLTGTGTWRIPAEEIIPVGPLRVSVRAPEQVRPRAARLLVSGRQTALRVEGNLCRFELSSVHEHEVVVIG